MVPIIDFCENLASSSPAGTGMAGIIVIRVELVIDQHQELEVAVVNSHLVVNMINKVDIVNMINMVKYNQQWGHSGSEETILVVASPTVTSEALWIDPSSLSGLFG